MRATAVLGFLVGVAALAIAGCDDSPPSFDDLALRQDLGHERFAGTWAVALTFAIGDASDGGAPPVPLTALAVFVASEPPATSDGGLAVYTVWKPCQLTLPGGLSLPFDDAGLATVFAPSRNAVAASDRPGTTLTQPRFAILGGAQLSSPLADPLPALDAPACGDGGATPCLRRNPARAGVLGLRAVASGLSPDADEVYVDFRLAFGFRASADLFDGAKLTGKLEGGALEWHVVGCRLRTGAACARADVIALEAARPSVSVTAETMRAHSQPSGFDCQALDADPEGALGGAGVTDGG